MSSEFKTQPEAVAEAMGQLQRLLVESRTERNQRTNLPLQVLYWEESARLIEHLLAEVYIRGATYALSIQGPPGLVAVPAEQEAAVMSRASVKDQLRHQQRREDNAPEPSAVFEPASEEEITLESVYRAECDNQGGLSQVDFDGAYSTTGRPAIVCLCGSTRFGHAFREANLRETLAGRIVLSIGVDMRRDADVFAGLDETRVAEIKSELDELHKRKIDLADEVLVLNVGGYVGDSTRSEIEYAQRAAKVIRWLEPTTDQEER